MLIEHMNELYKFARDGIYSTLQTNPLNVMMGRSSCKARHSALVFASAFMTLHKADSAESVGHCNFHTPKTGEKKCQFLSPNGLYSCKMICSLPFLNKLHTVVSHLAMHTVQREIQQGSGAVSKTCVSLLWDALSNLCSITQMKGNHKKGNATGNCEDWARTMDFARRNLKQCIAPFDS